MSESGMNKSILEVMLKKVQSKDCNLEGVSYSIKDKFLLNKFGKIYLIVVVRDTFGTDKRYSYSVVKFSDAFVEVLDKNSEDYKEVVKDLPDCSKYKYTSSEPLKRWKYEKMFEEIVDRAFLEMGLSSENKEDYLSYLEKMGKLKDISLYNIMKNLI